MIDFINSLMICFSIGIILLSGVNMVATWLRWRRVMNKTKMK
jgi:hypothetical protein